MRLSDGRGGRRRAYELITSPDHALPVRRRVSPAVAVSVYGLALAALAAVLFLTGVKGTAPLSDPHLPWWVIAVAWAVAEACVVHLQFRRSAHSFSLADLPFVFGLLFASGGDFLAGAL